MAQSGALRSLWFKWKSLRLPWRKRWLVGEDLTGNTFWEFKNELGGSRPRRIAQYPRSTQYSEVKLDPAWIQWLRHTRQAVPTVMEQRLDLQRQAQLKQLAAAADLRWKAKESFLDKPKDETAKPALGPGADYEMAQKGMQAERRESTGIPDDDPWKKHQSPSEGWQPQAWVPGKVER